MNPCTYDYVRVEKRGKSLLKNPINNPEAKSYQRHQRLKLLEDTLNLDPSGRILRAKK